MDDQAKAEVLSRIQHAETLLDQAADLLNPQGSVYKNLQNAIASLRAASGFVQLGEKPERAEAVADLQAVITRRRNEACEWMEKGENSVAGLLRADANHLLIVLHCYSGGKMEKARDLAAKLDTAVRDEIPELICQEIGLG